MKTWISRGKNMKEINKKNDEELRKIALQIKKDNKEYIKGENVENDAHRLWDKEKLPEAFLEGLDPKRKEGNKIKQKSFGHRSIK